jgi:hypothetical protein
MWFGEEEFYVEISEKVLPGNCGERELDILYVK